MEEELRPLQRLQHLAALDLSVWGLQPGAAAVVAAFPALQVRVPVLPGNVACTCWVLSMEAADRMQRSHWREALL
jgi:hypothetical protein